MKPLKWVYWAVFVVDLYKYFSILLLPLNKKKGI